MASWEEEEYGLDCRGRSGRSSRAQHCGESNAPKEAGFVNAAVYQGSRWSASGHQGTGQKCKLSARPGLADWRGYPSIIATAPKVWPELLVTAKATGGASGTAGPSRSVPAASPPGCETRAPAPASPLWDTGKGSGGI